MRTASNMLRTVLLVLVLGTASAMYSGSDDVTELSSSNFNKEVMGSDELWLVEFYAPWCGHCKNLAPEWKKAATALKGVVKIAAVDATAHESLGGQYGVKGFPTIKVFGHDKKAPTDYQGARQADGIISAALQEVSKMVRARTGGGGGGGGGGGDGGDGPVVVLTSSNFDDEVMGSDIPWLVEFYAPWCGHCKNLAPEWKSAARSLEDEGIQLGMLDATAHGAVASRFGVKGYPTIKFFPAGSSSDGDAEDYQGGRTADAIVAYADTVMVEVKVEVAQLLGQEAFAEACEAKTCIMAFLPHILDSGKAGREAYLETISGLATKNRRAPMHFVWSEGGAQSSFESAVELTFGFPALVAVNLKKEAYAVHRGAFDTERMGRFIAGISTGGSRVQKLRAALPELATVEKWDGQDAAVEEEEFSLEDIMGED